MENQQEDVIFLPYWDPWWRRDRRNGDRRYPALQQLQRGRDKLCGASKV